MLIASCDGVRVEAAAADRAAAFRCPGCCRDVTLKRGAVRTAHFAHQSQSSCGYASGESAVHMGAKMAVLKAFRERGLRAEAEHFVPGLDGDRRADVMVWSPSGRRIAVEIQHSSLGLPDILRRTESYIGSGIAVIWIPVLKPNVLDNAQDTEVGGLLIKRYGAPDWQRWINGYGYGTMWVMTSDLRLWSARLLKHYIYMPQSTWFEPGGIEASAGGFDRVSRRWKDLELSGPVDLADVRLQVKRRSPSEFGVHRYPGGPMAQFVTHSAWCPPQRFFMSETKGSQDHV